MWSAGGSAAQAVLGVVSLAIMARALGASSFGVYGVAITAIAFADMLVGSVLPDAIRQRETLEARHVDATFWASLIFSLVFGAVIALFAAPIAVFFRAPPDAAPVFIAVTALLPLSALAATPLALLSRELNYGAIARVETIASLCSIATGAPLALMGAGVWSLVAMELTRRSVRLVLAYAARPWRPGFAGGAKAFLEMAKFNGQTLAVYGFGFLDVAVAPFLIARLLGVEALGIYGAGRRVLESLTGAVVGPFTSVILSSAARLQNDRAALAALLASLYRASGLIAYPAFLGLAALAPVAVPLAFGEKWVGAVLPMQILMLIGLRTATGAFNAGVLRGVDKSHLMLILLALGVVLQIVLVPLGALYGVVGICAAMVARTWATWPLGAWFIKRETGLSMKAQADAGASAIPAAIGMALAISLIVARAPPLPLLAGFILYAALGAIIYLALLAVLAPSLLREALAIGKAILRRDSGALARGLQPAGEPLIAARAPAS